MSQGNTIIEQPPAADPQPGDLALAWQGSQAPPHTRAMTLQQVVAGAASGAASGQFMAWYGGAWLPYSLAAGDVSGALGYPPVNPSSLGNAAYAAVSNGTALVAAVGGTIASGHPAVFSDAFGSIADPGYALGTMAQQASGGIAVSGGTLDGVTIGSRVAAGATFSSLALSTALGSGQFFASPQGGGGAPSFRTMASGDVVAALGYVPGTANAVTYEGTWNAATNTPTLATGAASGQWYWVTAGGTQFGSVFVSGGAAVSNGTTWQPGPLPSSFAGTMASQNANAVAIVGGSTQGQQTLGLVTSDTWSPAMIPDAVWGVADSSGRLAAWVDYAGRFNAPAMAVSGLTVSGTFTLLTAFNTPGSVTAPLFSVGVSGDTVMSDTSYTPDVIYSIRDASGRAAFIVAPWGAVYIPVLSVGSLTVSGNAIGDGSGGGLPDAVSVKSSAAGSPPAVGNGVENFGYMTTSGSTLTVVNFSGLVSLSQANSNQALLTVTGAVHSGWAFQISQQQKLLYLATSGYTLLAPIAQWIDGQNVMLAAAGVTTLVNASGIIMCPAFNGTAASIGNVVALDGMGQLQWWSNNLSTKQTDTVSAYGRQMFGSTLAAPASGNSVTIAGVFPFAWSGMPGWLTWGAYDTNAVATAGRAAFNSSYQKTYFPTPGSIYVLPGMCMAAPGMTSYFAHAATDPGALLNGQKWYGDDGVTSLTMDTAGLVMYNRPRPIGAPGDLRADKTVFGRGTFRRARQLAAAGLSVNVFITGDSQGTPNPQDQSAGWMQVHKFTSELKAANPGVVINTYDMAVGGITWAGIANPSNTFGNSSVAPNSDWTVPLPISGSFAITQYLQNCNRTGAGAPIVPDVVCFFQNGGNDSWNIDLLSMRQMINAVLAIGHADSYGPCDIVLQTDHVEVVQATYNSGDQGGVTLAKAAYATLGQEYAATLHRTTAQAGGFGCVDLAPLVEKAVWGMSAKHRAMRTVPSVTAALSSGTPFVLPVQCRDFTLQFSLPNASGDSAAWASMQWMDVQISPHPANKVRMRLGANGNLWVGVSTIGDFTPTACTIASGTASLAVGVPALLSGVTYSMNGAWPQLYAASGTFASGNTGQYLVAPLGDFATGSYQLQRTQIRTVYGATDIECYDNNFRAGTISSATGSISYGGVIFMPNDSNSQPHVTLIYPDGMIYCTTVASGGYVSQTQATLVAAAPETLSNATVLASVGRYSVPWFDTGLNLSGVSGTGTIELDVKRGSVILSYQAPGQPRPRLVFDVAVERFGTPFYPAFSVGAAQQAVLSDIWVDREVDFLPSTTAWTFRGINDTNTDGEFGGAGGHPSSYMLPIATDVFYGNNDLCFL